MALIEKLSTLRQAMTRAEHTEPPYEFEPVEDYDARIVPIPISLDSRRDTLRQMINHRVTIEAEQASLAAEHENISIQIERHQIEFSKEMLALGIKAPMANEDE